MPDNPLQKIEKPKGAEKKPAKAEARVFTMPEKYRHGKQPMVELVKPVAPPPKPVAPPPPPPPKPKPTKKAAPTKPKKNGLKIILILGVLLLLVGGVGGYFYVRTLEEQVKPGETQPGLPTTPTIPKPPTPTPTPEPEPEPPTPSPFPGATSPGIDSDSDGLTDLEERLVYNTDARLPDSDSDGFLDGNEVFHRYNPNGLAPGTLEETGLVKIYEKNGYSILYPSVWDLVIGEKNPDEAILEVTTGEIIKIRVETKDETQTLFAWHSAKSLQESILQTTTKNGYASLVTENGLKQYIDGGNFVLILNYDSGIKGNIDYLQTFKMIVNSVVVK